MSYLKASHHPWKTNIASGELTLLRGQTEGWLQWSSHERVMMGHTDYCLIGHRVSRVDIRDCDWTDMRVSDWIDMSVFHWIEGHLDKHPNHLLFLLHHSSVIPTLCEAIALLISRET